MSAQIAGAAATSPLIGLIPFAGEPLGASALLPAAWSIGLVAAVTLLAASSALLSMRRVMVTPLGVARRETPARVHWIVIVLAVLITWRRAPILRLPPLPGLPGFLSRPERPKTER